MENLEKLRLYKDLKGKVKEVFSEEQMNELANAQIVPHYILKHPITNEISFYYAPAELNEWFYSNCFQRNFPKFEPEIKFLNIALAHELPNIPPQLTAIENLFCIPQENLYFGSGVYFLCKGKQIVYIGQSVNVGSRVPNHCGEKDFDSVFFIPVVKSKLDQYEAALIDFFNPPINKGKLPIARWRAKMEGISFTEVIETLNLQT
jgi:hypothetical protein